MKFNTYPLLFVIFAVIASAMPFNETMLNLMERDEKCPITHTDSCCYDHGEGCYNDVAAYAWGIACRDKYGSNRVPVPIKCDDNYNVSIIPFFGISGNNPGSYSWAFSEPCGGDDGCACCNDYNRGGYYKWANWCESKWEWSAYHDYVCFKWDKCSGVDCCIVYPYQFRCGESACTCIFEPEKSCASAIETYCWAKCGANAPCNTRSLNATYN
ncbi:hypothetical protein Glove_386g54 [Diversispora epigaea]|uniref:Uncharacterized protein n=1 Tax=Diversispora epigaea TaxID=1348612 RepID=A0A397H308_9GLOM|nr:hypothetical protein Glove_386g54 [Diversispora epigaea]